MAASSQILRAALTVSVLLFNPAAAHIASFGPGMYCRNGPDPSSPNLNSNAPVNPLYNLTRSQWWFQHDRGCDAVPPPDGEFLELPAGESFTVELANNQAFTTLSYDGKMVSDWPDGAQHPEDWHGEVGSGPGGEGCLPGDSGGYMHVQNETMAQGTAWAIAYESDLSKIQMKDLVVFSVLKHTPWHRLATYAVPSSLPATCPPEGCTCAWLWVPRGCGQPNMYMQPYKCRVSNNGPAKKLAKAQPPTYCVDDASKCVKGAKQMIVFNQLEGDNTGFNGGWGWSPGYNERNGYESGAQEDIFEDAAPEQPTPTTSVTLSSSSAITTESPTSASASAAPAESSSITTTTLAQLTQIFDTSSSTATTIAETSVHSYSTTVTGRIGKPTKFVCYAQED
ncbi:uncharacterized protein AB675_10192 [Cyphellophora attinorum]|uniref:Uncharacterized protein n=1 Tax=Cyphellophora attinorum TaxID=1664694 RepID=A0A0N0NHX4_9EURO|nr:uncharacterized protein AB675_10192 [Phialophora attinorum]KPI34779.1 hypothetical protein AB675_10192 [Phialophora attinorum]